MEGQVPVAVLDEEKKTGEKGSAEDIGSALSFRVESTIDKVKVARLALGITKVPKPNFDLGAELKEVSREGSTLTVEYVLYLESFPSVLRVEIQGVAKVRSPRINTNAYEDAVSEDLLSDVALEIFRNHYSTIYLLFDSMRLPFPSPWVVKNVHLV